MKSFVTLFVCVIFLTSCNNSERQHANNAAIIENYVHAVEAGNYDSMALFIADNYMGYGPSIDDSTNKTDGLKSWKYNLENVYGKIEYTKSRIIAVTMPDGPNAGEWVAHWAVATITYKDGRGPVSVYANTNYKIENGKIARSYTFYNELDVLEQLGER